MSKFKVGDFVEVVNQESCYWLYKEYIREVLGCTCALNIPGNEDGWSTMWFIEDELKLVEDQEVKASTANIKEYTGGSVSYYSVNITKPTTEGREPYIAECNDIIEALKMNYAEGNAFKAIWRLCAARNGKSKEGYKDSVYDAEKVVFFGSRMLEQAKEDNESSNS